MFLNNSSTANINKQTSFLNFKRYEFFESFKQVASLNDLAGILQDIYEIASSHTKYSKIMPFVSVRSSNEVYQLLIATDEIKIILNIPSGRSVITMLMRDIDQGKTIPNNYHEIKNVSNKGHIILIKTINLINYWQLSHEDNCVSSNNH